MGESEKLVCAAIKYKRKFHLFYQYVFGKTHGDCIVKFAELNLPSAKRNLKIEKQGFWTTKGRFVDRIEAKQIALEAGQISEKYEREELYSEYILWYANTYATAENY